MSVLRIENLVKKFGRDFIAVDNLSLTVEKGEVYGFLGPNGAGKSTTIRIILSLIKQTSGKIFLFDKEMKWGSREPFKRIGALVERPDFYNYLPAIRNLEFFGSLSGADTRKKNLYEMLDMVGLNGREKDKVKTYSLGMKQRLGIAQALLHNPDLIILDEPTNGLDPQGMHEIRELIKRLSRDEGKTVFLSSHILAEVESIATSMAIINKGKTAVQGKVSELLTMGGFKAAITVSDAIEAETLLKESKIEDKNIKRDGSKLEVKIEKSELDYVVDLLRMNGISVFEIKPSKTLEDYFLSVTQGRELDIDLKEAM
ncbi:MAG: ABC transporter ATP-binding protein [Candidatus Kapaibacteriales bacterium]